MYYGKHFPKERGVDECLRKMFPIEGEVAYEKHFQ